MPIAATKSKDLKVLPANKVSAIPDVLGAKDFIERNFQAI